VKLPPGWTRDRAGRLRWKLKADGATVVLFQRKRDGVFHRGVWLGAARGWDKLSLGTKDPHQAEQLGRVLLAKLVVGSPPREDDEPVRLAVLWSRYKQSPGYLDNAPSSHADAAARARVLLAHFGEDFDVRTLAPDDVKAFTARRLAGGIVTEEGRTLGPTRARSPQADLMLFRAMCRWAQTVRTAMGKRWLPDNPLLGVRLPSERNPRRALAEYGRLEKTREAIAKLVGQERVPSRRRAWRMLDCALVTAEGTGRRKSAILKLDWKDVDLSRRVIRWCAENDKAGTEWRVPITEALARELSEYRQAMDAGSGPVFPSWRDASRPVHVTALDHLLLLAEQTAGLPKLPGTLWHCWRRSWATERKAHAIRDVMHAGGWRTPAVLVEVYQAADSESVRAVVEEPRKVRTA